MSLNGCFKDIYNSVRQEPFKFSSEEGNGDLTVFLQPDKQGWLMKQGNFFNLKPQILNFKCFCKV